MMASGAITFFRIGRDGLTAEMRRAGRAWKKLPPSVSKGSCKWTATKAVYWTVSWAFKAAGLRRMNEESRWNVDSWDAVSLRMSLKLSTCLWRHVRAASRGQT